LWEGRGTVQANKRLLETLRTEGVGHLAAMLFMKHYCKYHGVTLSGEHAKHYTDNKGIVGRMQWFLTRCIKTTKDCLVPDYDVQAQVEQIYQEMQWDITTEWVRGHQDTITPLNKLPWQAQLNVRADILATKARFEITNIDRRRPMDLLPACKAHLKIEGEVITGKIAKSMRDAWCQVELRKHCKKNSDGEDQYSTRLTGTQLSDCMEKMIITKSGLSPDMFMNGFRAEEQNSLEEITKHDHAAIKPRKRQNTSCHV